MEDYTTGQVARAAGISEKAVRLYADRGLLPVDRDARNDHRRFSGQAVRTARIIALLRGVDLSLDEVRAVLNAPDRVAAFDDVWGGRRTRQHGSAAAGEHVRSALAGASPLDVEVLGRSLPERLTLDWHGSATLPRLAETIGAATRTLFDVLHHAQVDLAGSPFVVYHDRATALAPAQVSVRAPVTALVRPTASTTLSLDPAHDEAYVELDAMQAGDQGHLVAVHDALSSGNALIDLVPAGDNREVYLPSWGTGATGPVMEVAVPVTPAGSSCRAD